MKKLTLARRLLVAAGLVAAVALCGTASADDTIKFGFFSPQTGFAGADGVSALHGAQIAVNFINDSGGLLGKKVELVNYDDASKPDQAANVAQKLTQSDKVPVAVSGSYSFLTRPAAAIFQRAKTPLMTAYAVHPQITATGKYIFATSLPAAEEGAAAAWTVAKVMKKKKVALVTMDNDAGTSLAAAFKKEAKKLGLDILTEEKYSLDDKDLRPILTRIKGMNPDVIYANGYYDNAALLVNQRQELGMTTPVIGMEGFDSPKFIELSKPGAAEGTMLTTALDRDSKNPLVQKFLSEFQKQYNIAPDMVGASSFDAVTILAEAIKRAKSTKADAVVKALHGIKKFDGVVTGPFYGFTKDGQVIKPSVVQIVKDGAFHHFAVIDDPAIRNLH
ncbi:MAG: ABC transporter substrate-binding protein [Arenicellales bacterium]